MLVVVCGLPGVGKTTVAGMVAEHGIVDNSGGRSAVRRQLTAGL